MVSQLTLCQVIKNQIIFQSIMEKFLNFISVTNPGYMKENFEVQLLTWHKEGAGLIENVHNLDAKAWKQVEVVTIDIALDKKNLSANDYKEETDPR